MAAASPATAQTLSGAVIPKTVAQRHGLERAWYMQIRLDQSYGHVAHVTQHDGMLFVQTSDAIMHAVDAETGRTIWAEQIGRRGHLNLQPGSNDKYLGVVNGSMLYIVDRATGRLRWERQLGGSPGSGAALSETHAFVPMVDGLVEGYDLVDFKKTPWIYKSAGRVLVQPMITPLTVCWTTNKGHFYVASVKEPKVKYRLETKASIESRPAYWTPYLYACSLDGYVYAIDENTAQTVWKFAAGDPIAQPPVAINGFVYIVSTGRVIFRLDGKTGQEQWSSPNVAQFVSVSPSRVYGVDRLNRLVALDLATGSKQDAMPLGDVSIKVINRLTDRIYLSTHTGLLQCLHEPGLPRPLMYKPPQIEQAATNGSPEKAADEKAPKAAEEKPEEKPKEKPAEEKPAEEDSPFG